MSTTSENVPVNSNSEPIPGYRLLERIGVGGYGEVWKASAPGGLQKAVKIIHGNVEDARAIRELKSLNRAKGLSHPFILSLERIEVTDGHLVIVTELADATLKDRFEQCRAQGLAGVPRDELLQYMREAADALDYLFDHCSLQHLDVKAENLLLFGSHIKVADFGLMKDLQDSCVSIVSGLTPRYAAPEMFEGKPGRYSDQYSLAVLYQEMVSGQSPFYGNSIAALASQHLNCKPDLSALSPLDRFAVGKALSKEPSRRFVNCVEFVDRLMHRSNAIIMDGLEDASPTDAPEIGNFDTMMSDADDTTSEIPAQIHDGQTIQLDAPEVKSLPRLEVDTSQPVYRPTLFVGVGGSGGRTLARLRQLVADQLGAGHCLPALQFLYIDTDLDAINEIEAGPCQDGLREHEIVVAPLRQTQDYRSSVVSELESLSRRWIYNVPRSLRTQGLRALGRMAFLDHSQRILERVRAAILSCTDRESVQATAQESGLQFQESDPRVFVISSISGGTGGGMTIDLGYAIRQVLAECGYSDDEICAMLMYSTGGGSAACSFAPANAYSFLHELRYFAQPGVDYPGERACGLAGFRENGPTFRSTYLFDLGENISPSEFRGGIDQLAEYLLLNSVTPAKTLFDECRRIERETPTTESMRIRAAGLCSFRITSREDPGDFAERLCQTLVRKWKVGIESASDDEEIQLSDVERLYEACDPRRVADDQLIEAVRHKLTIWDLSTGGIAKRLEGLIQETLNAEPAEYLENVIRDSLEQPYNAKTSKETPVGTAIRRLMRIIGVTDEDVPETDSGLVSLRRHAMTGAQFIGNELGKQVRDWILGLVDTENARVDGARKAVAAIRQHTSLLQQEALIRREQSKAELELAWQPVSEAEKAPFPKRASARKSLNALLQEYARCLLNDLVCDATCRILRVVDPCITAAADQLRELWKDLTQFGEQFRTINDSAKPRQTRTTRGHERLVKLMRDRKLDLIQELDRAVESQFFDGKESLSAVLTKGSQLRESLAVRMRGLARQVVYRACRDDSFEFLQEALMGSDQAQVGELIRRCLEQATPELVVLGGSKRLLVSAPGQLDQNKMVRFLGDAIQEAASIAYQPNGDLYFCYELEDLPWVGLQSKLVRQRHDCQELASRLHTRINLEWKLF